VHDYHTEDFYFHANGDPVPGPVLIRHMHNEDSDPFRTTTEEVVLFCVAVGMNAIGGILSLRTTTFALLQNELVVMTCHAKEQADDASTITVPLADLREFAGRVIDGRGDLLLATMGRTCGWIKNTICPATCQGPAYCRRAHREEF
jgi:hypothetical protein